MTALVEAGGSLAYVVIGLGALGLLVTLILGGLAFTKRRIPLALWVLLPVAACAVGAIGSWLNAATVFDALATAAPDDTASMALSGLYDTLYIDWFARWVAAGLFACAAWGAAVGSGLAAGPEKLWTFGAAIAAAAATVIGAGAVGGYAVYNELGTEAFALAGLTAFGGFGVTLAATRRTLEEHMYRVAGMRFASSMCMLFSLSYAGKAMNLGQRMALYGPGGLAVQDIPMAQAIETYATVAAPVYSVTWIAFGFGLIIAFFGFFAEMGEVVQRFTLLDVIATGLILVALAGVRFMENTRTDALFAIGTHAPAQELFGEMGGELAAALLKDGKEVRQVQPALGGFGDVLVWVKETEEGGETVLYEGFRRRYAFDGQSWSADGSKLSEITVNPGNLPLLVLPGGNDALNLTDTLKALPEKKALVLLRASEAKADVEVPPDLGHRQVTFIPIELATTRDTKTEAFTSANGGEVYWGPVYWYGMGMDKPLLEYFAAVFEDTKSPGLHVVVDAKSRAKGVIASCLAVQMKKEGDAMVKSDRWCRLTDDKLEDIIEEAATAWGPPTPDNVKMTVTVGKPAEAKRKDPGGMHDQAVIDATIRRQLGAFGFCGAAVKAAGGQEPTTGKMTLDIAVTAKGRIDSITQNEKSKLQNTPIRKCIKHRMKRMAFTPSSDQAPSLVKLELTYK